MSNFCAFLIVDNLRVGGVQRLALDEAYSLAKRGFEIRIYVLEGVINEDDIRNIDIEYFEKFVDKIQVVTSHLGNFQLFNLLRSDIKKFKPRMILSHSAKGIFLSRSAQLSNFRDKNKFEVVGFVHQLITLSDNVQKIKRLALFCFAHRIHASSKQFVLEIEALKEKNPLWRIFRFKEIIFDRMGIDLDRIEFFQSRSQDVSSVTQQTLIFLSRVVGWKGFGTFFKFCESMNGKVRKVVFTVPLYLSSPQLNEFLELQASELFLNKGIAHSSFGTKSVHLYPTDYGREISFPQSIGLNVLECLALGIPSLISEEQFWSWPELMDSVLISTTDWEMNFSLAKILQLANVPKKVRDEERLRLLPAISIEQHIQRIISLI